MPTSQRSLLGHPGAVFFQRPILSAVENEFFHIFLTHKFGPSWEDLWSDGTGTLLEVVNTAEPKSKTDPFGGRDGTITNPSGE
jgi:hypothetical protein